ncbi:hypothetical protein QZM81_21795 [Burkholderia cepacia]|uniref:hypothetical protein n=1 Tax=Burkholderia cepacia TaxID=292 RepID=UPI002654A59A|nr:hypothetical protein [Burkholderia cepacia]MDN7858437.1 hypothetical protein [Burkholderia cepacia]
MARDLRAAAAGIGKAGKKEKKMPCNTGVRSAWLQSKGIERCAGRVLSRHTPARKPRDPASERRREMTAAAPVLGNACAAPALRQGHTRHG